MASFTVFPAIDLRRGRVVRLAQGDPNRETCYSDDPSSVARQWLEQGASWLHVINLDGALDRTAPENAKALRDILATGARVQFGGGVRSLRHLSQALEMGVERIILGTAAVEAPELVRQAVERFGPEHVAAGIDSLDGAVRVHGWLTEEKINPMDLARRLKREGLSMAIVTDIRRDGMSAGLNLDLARTLRAETGLEVIASGGAASLADVRKARAAGMEGVILGKALYDGSLSLREALRC